MEGLPNNIPEKNSLDSFEGVDDFIEPINENNDSNELDEEYRVITPEDIVSYKEWAKNKVHEWHDKVKPVAIFLTETSAVPSGWIIKEAWKKAYPDEDSPRFYRINPRNSHMGHLQFRHLQANWDKVEEYIKKRVSDSNSPVLVFDETPKGYGLTKYDLDINKPPENSIGVAAKILLKGGLVNVYSDTGMPWSEQFYLGGYQKNNSYSKKETAGKMLYIKPTRKKFEGFKGDSVQKAIKFVNSNPVAALEKDPELRKRALDNIHDLKLAGREAGRELHNELESDADGGKI